LLLGLALSPLNPLSRFLALRPIIFLGEISYAFYLVHTLVLSTLGAGGWAKAMSVTEVLIEVQNLGVALGLAAGIHVLVERPAREWLRRVLIRAPRKHPV
jgi:peptidoglycan/LPS O-acetylase OafA/YrhL